MELAQEVMVQVCGRRESVLIHRATARDLAVAVEKRFEVRPPFLFADQQGRLLSDDEAIAACVATGETLVVRLTEGVLYDFGRRVDQIRHLQWGFLADQLAVFKQDRGDIGTDIKKWRLTFEEEQSARLAADQDLQRGLDALHELLLRERGARDAAVQEAEGRSEEAHAKLRKAIDGFHGALRKEREDLQALLQVEQGTRDEVTQRLRNDLSELREALNLEESQRRSADEGLLTTMQQGFLARDSETRAAELHSLQATVRELEATLGEVKAEMRKAHSTFGDRAHEEQLLRQQDGREMSQQLEELRRGLENEVKERKLVDASVGRLAQELGRRSEEESKTRSADVDRLFRLLSDEGDKRQEADRKLANIVSAVEEGSGQSLGAHEREVRELEQAIEDLREQLKSEISQVAASHDDLERREEQCVASVVRLREDCKEAMQREVRSRLDKERGLRDEVDQIINEVRSELGSLAAHLHPHGAPQELSSRGAGAGSGGGGSSLGPVLSQHSARLIAHRGSGSVSPSDSHSGSQARTAAAGSGSTAWPP